MKIIGNGVDIVKNSRIKKLISNKKFITMTIIGDGGIGKISWYVYNIFVGNKIISIQNILYRCFDGSFLCSYPCFDISIFFNRSIYFNSQN